MIEKDTIQELFSKTFENHSAPVKPELWAGVQAKMDTAGTVGGAAAAKGLSALAKWIIGSAAVTSAAVVTTVVVMNSGTETQQSKQAQQSIPAQTENTTKENTTGVDSPKAIATNTPTDNKADGVVPPKKMVWTEPRKSDLSELIYSGVQAAVWSQPASLVDDTENKATSTSGGAQSSSAEGNKGMENTLSNTEGSQLQTAQEEKYAPAKIELPNVFTPNGDGANDKYEFITIENVKSLDLSIYDSNERLVFKSINEEELKMAWDGTILDSGDQAPEGIYTCQIIYHDLGGEVKTKKSYIYLKRKSGF